MSNVLRFPAKREPVSPVGFRELSGSKFSVLVASRNTHTLTDAFATIDELEEAIDNNLHTKNVALTKLAEQCRLARLYVSNPKTSRKQVLMIITDLVCDARRVLPV